MFFYIYLNYHLIFSWYFKGFYFKFLYMTYLVMAASLHNQCIHKIYLFMLDICHNREETEKYFDMFCFSELLSVFSITLHGSRNLTIRKASSCSWTLSTKCQTSGSSPTGKHYSGSETLHRSTDLITSSRSSATIRYDGKLFTLPVY